NIEMNGSKKTHCWTFLVTRSIALKASTRVPTQITCQTFKKLPGRLGPRILVLRYRITAALCSAPFHKGGEVYPSPIIRQPSISSFFRGPCGKPCGLERARSIAALRGLSTHCHESNAGAEYWD